MCPATDADPGAVGRAVRLGHPAPLFVGECGQPPGGAQRSERVGQRSVEHVGGRAGAVLDDLVGQLDQVSPAGPDRDPGLLLEPLEQRLGDVAVPRVDDERVINPAIGGCLVGRHFVGHGRGTAGGAVAAAARAADHRERRRQGQHPEQSLHRCSRHR
jgi:hypothetical protein